MHGPAPGLPEWIEVEAYVRTQTEYHLRKHGASLPDDQQSEIRQECLLRAWQNFSRIEEARGWKSFMNLHTRGAVLDYIKRGSGFEEDRSFKKLDDEQTDSDAVDPQWSGTQTIRERAVFHNDDGEALGIDETLARAGEFTDSFPTEEHLTPNWPLLSRFAGVDEDLHIVCKVILGFSQNEIAYDLGTSRERVSQRYMAFFEKLDAPENMNSPLVDQMIFALGLKDFYHEPNTDNGYGWDLKSFDLTSRDSFNQVNSYYRPVFQLTYDDQSQGALH